LMVFPATIMAFSMPGSAVLSCSRILLLEVNLFI